MFCDASRVQHRPPFSSPLTIANSQNPAKTKPQKPTARLHFADGRISTFRDQALAYQTWLSLPRGVRAAFRGKGDNRPVYPWDFANQP